MPKWHFLTTKTMGPSKRRVPAIPPPPPTCHGYNKYSMCYGMHALTSKKHNQNKNAVARKLALARDDHSSQTAIGRMDVAHADLAHLPRLCLWDLVD